MNVLCSTRLVNRGVWTCKRSAIARCTKCKLPVCERHRKHESTHIAREVVA